MNRALMLTTESNHFETSELIFRDSQGNSVRTFNLSVNGANHECCITDSLVDVASETGQCDMRRDTKEPYVAKITHQIDFTLFEIANMICFD